MIAFGLFTLLVGATASAQPTYLQCEYPGSRGPVKVTTNEANSLVSLVTADGTSERLPAQFTATEVQFENETGKFIVSRTDLVLHWTMKFNGDLMPMTVPGHCNLTKPPKRAF